MRAQDGFARRLRESRHAAGFSQLELADASGISKSRISRYENGHVKPSLQMLHRLARALNISEATLFGDGRDVVQACFLRLQARGVAITSRAEARELADRLADELGAPSLEALTP